jgi:hypothetical protein
MSVAIGGGTTFEAGVPEALFEAHYLYEPFGYPIYPATAEGQRFLVNAVIAEESSLLPLWSTGPRG